MLIWVFFTQFYAYESICYRNMLICGIFLPFSLPYKIWVIQWLWSYLTRSFSKIYFQQKWNKNTIHQILKDCKSFHRTSGSSIFVNASSFLHLLYICHRRHRRFLCKFFHIEAKNWIFYLWVFLVIFLVFLLLFFVF